MDEGEKHEVGQSAENRKKEENSSYEKLRDELFETRVDVKAWIGTLKILAASVTIILAILAYFGYDKIESIERAILEKSNARLALTDSLLARIDKKKLDSLNVRLVEKQKEYEATLNNFERVLSKNKELEDKLYSSLPANEVVGDPGAGYDSFLQASAPGDFELRPFEDVFHKGEKVSVYLTFSDSFEIKKAEYLGVLADEDKPKGEGAMLEYYRVQQRLNKLSFVCNLGPGKYKFFVGFFSKESGKTTFYEVEKTIEVR